MKSVPTPEYWVHYGKGRRSVCRFFYLKKNALGFTYLLSYLGLPYSSNVRVEMP